MPYSIPYVKSQHNEVGSISLSMSHLQSTNKQMGQEMIKITTIHQVIHGSVVRGLRAVWFRLINTTKRCICKCNGRHWLPKLTVWAQTNKEAGVFLQRSHPNKHEDACGRQLEYQHSGNCYPQTISKRPMRQITRNTSSYIYYQQHRQAVPEQRSMY